MQVAIAKRARDDAAYCGDECGYWRSDGMVVLCIVDGLGHGLEAERAARAAVDYVGRHAGGTLTALFAGCDLALQGTRGVAMGIGVIDEDAGTLTYAGVGNTRAMIIGERTVRLKSDWGIVGGGYRALKAETLSLDPGDLVVLTSDGVKEMIDLSGYDTSPGANLQQLAERVLEDWGVDRDDGAVLIFRKEPPRARVDPEPRKVDHSFH